MLMKKTFNLKVLLEIVHTIRGRIELLLCCFAISLFSTSREVSLFAKTAEPQNSKNK